MRADSPEAGGSTVRYHEMLPRDVLRRRAACPVAFVGIGTLEWHAEHAALGLDGLKAERLCELAAEASGGFAFPTIWYGEPRSIRHMNTDHEDSPAIGRALRLIRLPALPGSDPAEEIERFQTLVRHVVLQIYGLGMRVVCLLSGHYPLYDWLAPVVKDLNAEITRAVTIVGSDVDFIEPADADVGGADHAGVWETSYLWYLRPDCVDLSVYEGREGEPLVGVIGEDPRRRASRELGKKACDRMVAGMVVRTQAALQGLPADYLQ